MINNKTIADITLEDSSFRRDGLSMTNNSSNRLPWVDLIPIDKKSPPSPKDVRDALTRPGCEWRQLREIATKELGDDRDAFNYFFSAWQGVVGVNPQSTFFIRFVYDSTKTTSLDALYELDAQGLSRTIAGAILAATKLDLEYLSPEAYAPSTIAALCNQYNRWPALKEGAPRIGRRELEQYADDVIQYLLSMNSGLATHNHDMEIPCYDAITNNIDVARLWIMVAQRLWRPNVRSLLAQSALSGLPYWSQLLAFYGQVSRQKKTVLVNGAKLKLYTKKQFMPMSISWSQVIEWERHQTPGDAIKYLSVKDNVLPNLTEFWMNTTTSSTLIYEALDRYDDDMINGLTRAFLHDASVNGVYIPTGKFTINLPLGYPLRLFGTKSLRVWAEPDKLIVSMIGANNNNIGPCITWSPNESFCPLTMVTPLTEVTLAALWRDLRVAGEIALPSVGTRDHPRRKQGKGRSRHRKRKQKSVRTLPGKRYVRIAGNRQWGSDEEHDAIHRQAHGVRGHLRRLRPGWAASGTATATAGEFGMTIPDGFTFVRPHIRGEGHVDAPDSDNEVIIRSRGLASVMTLLIS